MSKKRSRGWCYTINNYTNADVVRCMWIGDDPWFNVAYQVMGYETGESGTPHIQGYVYFKNPKHFDAVKSYYVNAHIEPQKAKDNVDAIEYCKKDGDYYEQGVPPSQGYRSDLDSIRESIKAGAKDLEIADANFGQWCHHRRSFQEYRKLLAKYDTKIVCYDHTLGVSIKKLYDMYEPDKDFVYTDMDDIKFLLLKKTSQYRYIYVRRVFFVDTTLEDFVDEFI